MGSRGIFLSPRGIAGRAFRGSYGVNRGSYEAIGLVMFFFYDSYAYLPVCICDQEHGDNQVTDPRAGLREVCQ